MSNSSHPRARKGLENSASFWNFRRRNLLTSSPEVDRKSRRRPLKLAAVHLEVTGCRPRQVKLTVNVSQEWSREEVSQQSSHLLSQLLSQLLSPTQHLTQQVTGPAQARA